MAKKNGSKHELLEYESVRLWMSKVGGKSGSTGTQKVYLRNLRHYCEWFGKNPDEMIEERKEQAKNQDESIKQRHEDKLDEFFNEIEGDKSRNTAVLRFKTVKSFYKANHYPLTNVTPRTWTTFTDKVPSLDELHKMVEASDSPVQKALLLFYFPLPKVLTLVLCSSRSSRYFFFQTRVSLGITVGCGPHTNSKFSSTNS